MHELPHREVGESMAIRLASGGLWLILNKYTDLMNKGTECLQGSGSSCKFILDYSGGKGEV